MSVKPVVEISYEYLYFDLYHSSHLILIIPILFSLHLSDNGSFHHVRFMTVLEKMSE